jgi:RHS repeat-associated protein
LKADGSIVAWGYNGYGQCTVPIPNTGFIGVTAGSYHNLGLKADGSIVAWGNNGQGQCNVPTPNSGFLAVVGGYEHSLGLKADGSIVAWGLNSSGQCTVPVPNTGFIAMAAGERQSLGIKQLPSFALSFPANESLVSTNEIPFAWSNTHANYYKIWVDDDSEFSSPELQPRYLQPNNLNHLFVNYFELSGNSLASGITYYWKVKAYTDTDSIQSAIWSFTYSPPIAPAPEWAPLYRLYNPDDTDHFYCSSQGHQQIAENQGYRAERIEGFVSSVLFNDPDMAYVFRFYDDARDCHYYTSRPARVDSLIAANLRYEGITGYVYAHPDTGLVPLHHLSAPNLTDNLYTTSEVEREYAVETLDFTYEDILGWVSPIGDTSNIPAHMFAGLVGAGMSPGTGNLMHYTESDFAIPSTGLPLTFEHVYNSLGVQLLSAVQPLGPGWSHTYNAYILTIPNLWLVVWPDGSIHRYSQETGQCLDRVLGVYDQMEILPGGKFEITKKDQVVYTFERPAGASIEIPSYLTSIRDRNHNTITCTYEPSGLRRLKFVTGTTGHQLAFEYEHPDTLKSRYITSVRVTPSGRTISFAYADSNSNLTSYTDCAGKVTQYVYLAAYREDHMLKQVILPEGNTVTNDYAERRAMGQSWNGSQISLSYGSNYATATDGQNTQTRYDFDALKRITDVTDLSGGTGAMHYARTDVQNPALPTSIQDRNGNLTTITYDERGNALSINKPLGVHHVMTYNLRNDLETYTDPRDHTTTYGYDSNGNLTSLTDPLSRTTTYYCRSDGLVQRVEDPMSRSTYFNYDSHGNLTDVTDNLTNHTVYIYDEEGRLLLERDPEGYETVHTYDCEGRRLTTRDAAMGVTEFAYDDNGNLERVEDAEEHPTTWVYNALDLVESATNAVGDQVRYIYREDGRLGSRQRPTGTTTYGYDNAGRLNAISSSGATLQRDGNGNIISLSESHGATTYNYAYTYDALNRLSTITDNDSKTVSYTYDEAGNLLTITYEPGKVVTYTYYNDNRMRTVTDWLQHTTTYTYYPDGSLQGIAYPNNTSASFSYDGAGRLQDLVHRMPGGAVIASYHYDLDGRGYITAEDRQEPLGEPTLPVVSESYNYNAANRLLSVGTTSYGYDGAGNMTSRTGSNPITCTYDLENRLTGISGSTNASFVYDTFGNRRAATRNGVTTKYVLDLHGPMSQVLMEADASGSPRVYYVYGIGLISRIGAGPTPDYGCYHFNQVGSIVAVSDHDGVTLTHQYSYSPFGEVIASSVPPGDQNPFIFGGLHGVMAEGNDQYYMRARYYDSITGRFMGEDPIWGTQLYAYSSNNPVRLVDPSGEATMEDFWRALSKNAAKEIRKPLVQSIGARMMTSGVRPLGLQVVKINVNPKSNFAIGATVDIYDIWANHSEWDNWEKAQRTSFAVTKASVKGLFQCGITKLTGSMKIGEAAGFGASVFADTYNEELYQGTVKLLDWDWLSDSMVPWFTEDAPKNGGGSW